MSTLYVVGVTPRSWDDLTFRARRVLGGVGLVAAGDLTLAADLLAHLGLETPLVAADDRRRLVDALARGDVALLLDGRLPGPVGPELQAIRAALAHDAAVVPVPGPVWPISALVSSGLPTDSFCFLGQLPARSAARIDLLTFVAAEQRSLVALAPAGTLLSLLDDVHAALGDRPLVLVPAAGPGRERPWRGTVADVLADPISDSGQGDWLLILGGAEKESTTWDEARLRAEINAGLERGLRARDLSKELAAESGWPRREIYRWVVEQARTTTTNRKET